MWSWWGARAERELMLAEAQALVTGTYLDYLLERGRAVPPWAVVNAAAHGDSCRLRRSAAAALRLGPWYADPAIASAIIAKDVAEVTGGDDCARRTLQAGILIPFELHLLGLEPASQLSIANVVASVRALLNSARL